jgi:pimeloyl-ACP methyl ester carboxylesterase
MDVRFRAYPIICPELYVNYCLARSWCGRSLRQYPSEFGVPASCSPKRYAEVGGGLHSNERSGWIRSRIFSWNVAAGASPKGTLDCVSAWLTDFRKDLKRIDVPTLVIHGDSDRILPIAATGKHTAELVKGSKLVTVEGGPHGLLWTHAEKVNRELLDFLGQKPGAKSGR